MYVNELIEILQSVKFKENCEIIFNLDESTDEEDISTPLGVTHIQDDSYYSDPFYKTLWIGLSKTQFPKKPDLYMLDK